MRYRIIFLALALIGLCSRLEAIDVPEITFMPTAATTGTLPGSPALGTFPPFVPQPVNFCSGNTLATGLLVSHNGSNVTGLALRCRNFGVIGATETSPVFDQPLLGSTTGSTSRMLECDSGEAITGLRVRSGTLIDAVGISCHAVSPSFGTVVHFTADILFLNGNGAAVNAGATSLVTGLIGGTGGSLTAFECGSTTPFVRAIQTPTSGGILGLKASCSRVLTKPIDHAATQPDLVPRTVSQRRSLAVGGTDSFRVEVFNLGGPIPNPDASAFVDVIFSSDVAITARPPECNQLSQGRLRCSIPGIDGLSDGALGSLNGFIVQANGQRLETALFVVQTSFEIDDSDFGNNTYAFAVNVH
jgi:hypothetical protein